MRTVRYSGRWGGVFAGGCASAKGCLPGGCLPGGVCPGGCLPRGVSAQGGVCLPRGVCLGGSVQGSACPVGCLPSGVSARGVCLGLCVSAQGGVSLRGCLPREFLLGVSAQGDLQRACLPGSVCPGGCLPRGCLSRGVYPSMHWADTLLWTEWLTDRCKNITFPQLRLRTVIKMKILIYITTLGWAEMWTITCQGRIQDLSEERNPEEWYRRLCSVFWCFSNITVFRK